MPWDICRPLMRHVQGLPEMLLPYLRLAHCTDSESLKQASLDSCCSAPISPENELTVLHQLASHLQTCLSRCPSIPCPHMPSPSHPTAAVCCASWRQLSVQATLRLQASALQ